LIKAIARMGAKEKMDIPVYEGNLDAEELLDYIRALDTYFDYEDVEEDRKFRHAITRLKGHAALWWDVLVVEPDYLPDSEVLAFSHVYTP
jgi:hypothetical protein